MNILVIVPTQPLLLILRPGADRHAQVPAGVLGADHEADLAGWVGGDGGVGVVDGGEDLLAGLFQVGDEFDVKPLVFGCIEGTN